DLAKRKLVPALWHLHQAGYLPDKYAVVGFSRTEMSDQAYQEAMLKGLQEAVKDEAKIGPDDPVVRSLYYCAGNNDDAAAFARLKARIEAIEKERGLPGNRLFYLSVAPEFFATIIKQLDATGL